MAAGGCTLFEPPPAWEQPPPPPTEGPIVEAERLHRTTLANGLRVIVLEDDRLPRVSLGLELRRGAGSVPPSKAGVAAVATEVMQRGAGDRDALELARAVEDVGASLAVGAGWDSTQVSLQGLAGDRGLLFEILEDVALRPRFEPAEFDKAVKEQQAALVAAQDDPATVVQWHALRTLYEGHRYGLPQGGSPATVAGLDVADARSYWTDRFVPGNTIFWAVGDFEADEVIEEARRRFGALPDAPVPAPTPAPPSPAPPMRRVVVVDDPSLVQARIVLAHDGMARTEPDRIAANVMNDVLGGSGFSSRLMQSIRSDAGLTYGVGSGFSLRRRPGPFSVSTFTRVPEVRRVVDLILEEVEALQTSHPIDAGELSKFVRYNLGRFGLSLETSEAVLGAIVDLDVYGLPPDSLDTYRSRLRDVTVEDLARVAEKWLHPERAAIVVLGPAGTIVPTLQELGSVSVVAPGLESGRGEP